MSLPRLIFLVIFFLVPLIEIYLLIQVGSAIGAIPTILLIILTAVFGTLLLRHQGLATLQNAKRALAQGQIPAFEIIEGIIIIVSGALLLTPGFFTDTLGLLCLITSLRQKLIRRLIQSPHIFTHHHHPPQDSNNDSPQRPRTIEGEYWHNKDNH